jgi:long-chain acyl-CoA synthetase
VTALYDGSTEAAIDTEVTFEDVRRGTLAARVRILDIPEEGTAAAKTPMQEKAA